MTDIPIVGVNQVEWLQSKSLGEIQGIKEGITPSGNGPRDRCPGSATDKRLVSFVITRIAVRRSSGTITYHTLNESFILIQGFKRS